MTAEGRTRAVSGSFSYRPHLDGLRAVAVYLVLLFHAGLGSFPGGFIGVDVFFVLSGYLVTQVLLGELQAGKGVRFGRFYSRRFRRLLPASFVTLVVTAVVWSSLVSPAEVAQQVRGFRAAFLYYANWHFIWESADYFAADIHSSPVLHFWSLAIEEQFYLAWPLALTGLFWIGRRTGRPLPVVRVAVGVAMTASVVWAWHLSGSDISRAYYGTDARAYQLLAGAMLALTPDIVERARRLAAAGPPVALAAGVALVVAASSLLEVSAITRGVIATVLTISLLVALEISAKGPARRVLESEPVVYLGRVSYGTYLWHWPVIVVANLVYPMAPRTLALVTMLVATGIASLSFQLMENPIRRPGLLDRVSWPVVACGLSISIIAGLAIVPRLEKSDTSVIAVPAPTADDPGETVTVDWQAAQEDTGRRVRCDQQDVAACLVVDGGPIDVVLVGDSHAQMLMPGFEELAQTHGWRLWAVQVGNCGWERGVSFVWPDDFATECIDAKDDWYDRMIPEIDPELVVLSRLDQERGFEGNKQMQDAEGRIYEGSDPALHERISQAAAETVDALVADGRKVAIIEQIPLTGGTSTDPTQCLSQAEALTDCDYTTDIEPSPAEVTYRMLADDPSVISIDLDPLMCTDLPVCHAIERDTIVRQDWSHITGAFARAIGPDLFQAFVDAGFVPDS